MERMDIQVKVTTALLEIALDLLKVTFLGV
jgi:hypothetical protein